MIEQLTYHNRYCLQSGQMVCVVRCRACRKTRCFAKSRTALNTQTQLFNSYYSPCRVHWLIKGSDAGTSDGVNQSQPDVAGTANLQRRRYFKNQLGGYRYNG